MIEEIKEGIGWLFSGSGFSLIGLVMKWFRRSNKSKEKKQEELDQIRIENASETMRLKNSRKGNIPILFIDDKKVSFISAMKKAGYESIKWLKDCDKIDCEFVASSDIIFVDINGVGTSLFPQEQGLGLAKAIKQKFPGKCIVIYSAEPQYLKNDFRMLDAMLPKNSEPYEFIKIIDDWSEYRYEGVYIK